MILAKLASSQWVPLIRVLAEQAVRDYLTARPQETMEKPPQRPNRVLPKRVAKE